MLGSYCDNFTYYAFGVTSWGRLVFCGSPRRYEPRWFRSPEMRGIKEYMSDCAGYDGEVAQAPDGLFLSCVTRAGRLPEVGARRPVGRPADRLAAGVNLMFISVSPRRMNVGS